MEPDARYFWRRAVEELAAARRSLTPQARERHQHFVRLYLDRLARLGAPKPFTMKELEPEFAAARNATPEAA